jgi:hypothetical protein
MPETAEELSKKPEVRQELARTSREKPREKVKAKPKDKFWFVTHALLLIACAALYFFLGSKLMPLSPSHLDLARRFLRGTALIVIVVAIAKAISVYALGRIEDAATRFTLRRIEHFISTRLFGSLVANISPAITPAAVRLGSRIQKC